MPDFRAHRYKRDGKVGICIRCGSKRRAFNTKRGFRYMYARPEDRAWSIVRPPCSSPGQTRLRGRFEDGFDIRHCGVEPKLLGNMSLREGDGPNTTVAYECKVCFMRFALVDEIAPPSKAQLAVIDSTP